MCLYNMYMCCIHTRVRCIVHHLGKFTTQVQGLRAGKRIQWDIVVTEMKGMNMDLKYEDIDY